MMNNVLSLLAEYLSYSFVQYALITGVLIALCSSLLGVTLVLKRYSFMGDGLSHVAFGAMAVAAVLVYTCCSGVREKADTWYAAHFGDRGISRKFNNANFARALSMGLGSALPLEDAVERSGELLEDVPEAAARCRRCAQALRGGAPLQTAMQEAGFLPPAESRMLAVGLRQGSSDRVMADIADRLLADAQESLERTVAKAEPAMVLAASVLVGLILLSVMLPLMNMMAAIG